MPDGGGELVGDFHQVDPADLPLLRRGLRALHAGETKHEKAFIARLYEKLGGDLKSLR